MTQENETPEAGTQATEGKTGGIDRRSVVMGAAWSIPVIALAVATPAAAASGDIPPVEPPKLNCEPRNEIFDPTGSPELLKDNVAKIEYVLTKEGTGFIRVTYVKDHRNTTRININGIIVKEYLNGAKAGEVFLYNVTSPADACFFLNFIQVDGNNMHWLGHVNGGKGGFQ